MTYSVFISAAGPEPVSVSQVRMHTRIDDNTLDAALLDYIATARSKIEQWTGLVLRPCIITFKFDKFDTPILLPRAPVRSITSIAYTDGDGDAATVAGSDYELREYMGRPQVKLGYGGSWPAPFPESQVVITTVGGFETANDIDPDIITGIWTMVAHQVDNAGLASSLEEFASRFINHRLSWAF